MNKDNEKKNEEEFYNAFLKLINEFKEVREVYYEDFYEILNEVKIQLDKSKENFINNSIYNCMISSLLIIKEDGNYYNIISEVLKKINYPFIITK